MSDVIIDVRERDEYEIEHIEHSINVPLSSFSAVAPGVLNQLKNQNVTFMCLGGMRALQACEQAKGLGFENIERFTVYDGGLMQWVKNGEPVMKKMGKTPLPLMRQMQIGMGTLFVIFASLGAFVDPLFSIATIGFGAGLFYAGLTGECGVSSFLAKAPWNRADPTLKDAYCRAAGNCQ